MSAWSEVWYMVCLPIITISAPGGRGDAMVLKSQVLSTYCKTRVHQYIMYDPNKVSKALVEVSSDSCYAMVPLVSGQGRKEGNLEICVSRKGSNLTSCARPMIVFTSITYLYIRAVL